VAWLRKAGRTEVLVELQRDGVELRLALIEARNGTAASHELQRQHTRVAHVVALQHLAHALLALLRLAPDVCAARDQSLAACDATQTTDLAGTAAPQRASREAAHP
jgi:hypothetical protein